MDTISPERRKYKTEWQREKRQEQMSDPEKKLILLKEYKEQSKRARAKRTPEQIEKQRLRNREWLNEHREEVNQKAKIKARIRYKQLKTETISIYGGKCECCSEDKIEFLAIDHIDGGGNKQRKELKINGGASFYAWLKRNNYPRDKYRVLCHNCNQSYGSYGYCPHQEKSS